MICGRPWRGDVTVTRGEEAEEGEDGEDKEERGVRGVRENGRSRKGGKGDTLKGKDDEKEEEKQRG